MGKLTDQQKGFTLVEVLVSIAIMLAFLPFAAGMLTSSQLLASYSKHKIEAAYAAQQIIEQERQMPYSSNGSYNNFASIVSINTPFQVNLDTKGDYQNLSPQNHFYGKATVSVSSAVYTTAGKQVANANVDHVVVSITWNEQIGSLQVPMTETYAEDIANDATLN